jgi:hypothetical protein
MSHARRKALIQLARRYDALIICDDVYDLVYWPTEWHARPDSLPVDITRVVDLDIANDGRDLPAEDFGNSGQGVASDGLRRRLGLFTVFPKCELTLPILLQISYTLLTRTAAVRLVLVALLPS